MILYKKYQSGGPLDQFVHRPGEIFDPLVEDMNREPTVVDIVGSIIEDFGGTQEQYNKLADSIAFHESKKLDKTGKWVYMDPQAKQSNGGPGRGLYQFEMGNNAGGITAARRAVQYYNKKGFKVPEWLNKAAQKNSLDASTLSPDQQKILFLANHRMGPSKLSSYIKGDIDEAEFWAKYHHTQNDPEKIKNFKADFRVYLPRLFNQMKATLR